MRRQGNGNMAQVKEQIKTPEKELNEIEMQSSKHWFITMLKELSEDLDSIKKIQSDTKDTLIEIKNNLQGNISKVDEAKNQINMWNIRKQKTTNQNKKNTKKRIV